MYFRKFVSSPLDINKYFDIVKLYDLSLFDQIKKLLPARSKPATGVLIEPHILERPKIKWERPVTDNRSYEGVAEATASTEGEFILKEGETKDNT